MRAVVFVGGRADLGPLMPVIGQLGETPDCELLVATAVAMQPEALRAEVAAAGHTRLPEVTPVGPVIGSTDPVSLAAAGAAISVGMAGTLRAGGDVLVVLGDRWELPWVVMPAVLGGVPVVHLHGGEVTEGAIDERVRHAVSKLADQHCVASADAAARLRQMGEEPARIHVTGAPGLDRYVGQTAASNAEIEALLGAPLRRPLALFTYHPVTTAAPEVSAQHAAEALRATARAAGSVIATHPGPDHGREQILAALTETAATHASVTIVPSLGVLYPACVAACDVVVGNSSSGIIEAATFEVPAVDIGIRQGGRLRGDNVLQADDGFSSVSATLHRALDPSFRASLRGMTNPYGDGSAARRVAEVVVAAAGAPTPKRFEDIRAGTDAAPCP
ncbi:MAG TPA: UDP-N-acetylglucosamine 2-epimerase [Blastococcus sp.]|jgi:UDP-N-acetylglucosamine 2-epimerase (non-hydrolysing)|nr:UDP-N-acetylglucosamine 2-epimerase [Blastococcus sp.]